MKVLFVGEGRHDLGASDFPLQFRTAQGVVPKLCQKISNTISSDSIALSWKDIPRFNSSKKGFKHKLKAAALIAKHNGCEGLIAVVDQDNDHARLSELQAGKQESIDSSENNFKIAVGVAVKSIEAWTLGDEVALARALGSNVSAVRQVVAQSEVEKYHENSGKTENRPKGKLNKLCQASCREDCLEFRLEVAEATCVTRLGVSCPQGFEPFKREVESVFAALQPGS